MSVFNRLKIRVKCSLSITKLKSGDGGFVDPTSFFKQDKEGRKYLAVINSILSPIFGDNWKDKQYQDNPKSNLSKDIYFHLKSKILPTKKRYVGDTLIGMWYEFYRLNNGHIFAVVTYDEPTSPPTKAIIINDEDFHLVNNL
jgi:hypothetical protein